MNIKQLEYFEEICRCRSLSKAAKNLFISQQGLSMSMLRLEDELSCKLFNRGPKGVTMTDEGQFLHEHAEIILEHSVICEEHFANSKPRVKTIRIGTAYGSLSEFGAEIFLDFQNEHPNIHIVGMEYPGALLDKAVENEEVEMGLAVAPIDESKFNAVPIMSIPLCLVVSDQHPLAGHEKITYEDLNDLQMVTVNENFKSSTVFIENCHSHDSVPNVRLTVGEVMAVHRIVSSIPELAGLSTTTAAAAFPMPGMVEIPFEDPELSWNIYLITKKEMLFLPSTQTLIKYICQHVENKRKSE